MKKIILSLLLLGTVGTQTATPQTSTAEQTDKKINLYIYDKCPYCKTVIKYLKKNGWFKYITVINVDNAKKYAQLQSLSGSTQCPFLNDEVNNVKMLESKKIMQHFHKIFSA